METKPRTLFNNSLFYGSITGAGFILMALVMYITELPMDSPVGYVSYVILLAGIIYGTLEYRNKSLGGYISYGQAFLAGFLVIVFASVLSSIYTYVFFTFFDPEAHAKIVETAMEKSREKMIDNGMADDQIETALNISKSFMSPISMALMSLLMNSLVGGLVSLITAAFLKKADNSFEGQFKENS